MNPYFRANEGGIAVTGMAHQSHWVKGWMLIAAFGLLGISPGYAGEGSGKGGPRVLPDGAGQPIPGRYIVLFKSNTNINECMNDARTPNLCVRVCVSICD